MLSRRQILRGAVAAGGGVSLSAGALAKADAPAVVAPEAQNDREGMREVAKAIEGLDETLPRAFVSVSLSYGAVAALRKGFETFLRSTGKFPDFCEVGTSVFFDMYDWHVKNRQQITVLRQPDNRYTMQFMFTQLVLRYDYDPGYVGPPYDNR